jgi:hypothetical protein
MTCCHHCLFCGIIIIFSMKYLLMFVQNGSYIFPKAENRRQKSHAPSCYSSLHVWSTALSLVVGRIQWTKTWKLSRNQWTSTLHSFFSLSIYIYIYSTLLSQRLLVDCNACWGRYIYI